jgi:hypothetical protein
MFRSKPLYNLTCIIAMLLSASSMAFGGLGRVLCFSDDGHIGIERSHPKGQCGIGDDHFGDAGVEFLTAESDSCSDFALPDASMNIGRTVSVDDPAIYPVATVLQATVAMFELLAIRPPDMPTSVAGPPSLLSHSTVVLLV